MLIKDSFGISRPNLVDYSLFKPRVKEIPPIITKITKTDNSFLINIISILILSIGLLYLYLRFRERNEKDIEKQRLILNLNKYVNENIK